MPRKTKAQEALDDRVKDFLAKAKKRLEFEIKADAENRRHAVEALEFLVPGNQWGKERDDRTKDGRPCIEVPIIAKFPAQVVGDMLHNRARITVKAVDYKADPHIARIRQGIIATTEYISNAEDIYLEAGKTQVPAGYGAWRVGTRYCEDNPFLQEIYEELIPNPFNVYLDSRRKDAAGADAKYGFIYEMMPKETFEERWPNAEVPKSPLTASDYVKNLYSEDEVCVIEYFVVKPEKTTFCQMEDGTVLPEDDAKELIEQWKELRDHRMERVTNAPPAPALPGAAAGQTPPEAGASTIQPPPGPATPGSPAGPPGAAPVAPPAPPQAPAAPLDMPPEPRILKKRTTPVNRIRRYTLTMNEILPPPKDGYEEYREEDDLSTEKLLDGEPIPGCYIPIVQVTGPTLNIKGKTIIMGLVRRAKDAQRLVNYWETVLAETIALAPKSPWVATAEQIEGYENDYVNANVKNYAVLKYNAVVGDNGQLLPPPMRQSPSAPPTALFTQAQRAHDNLKAVIGMFGGDVGEVGPERSAPAVYAKQKPGDISTYVYSYNLNRGIEHAGKIINSMIPEVYDSERDVRLRNVDDSEAIVPINTSAATALKNAKADPNRYPGMDVAHLEKIFKERGRGALFNDVSVGKYDVVVKAGPSYATQRQEAATLLQQMTQADPKGMAPFRHILFGSMDFLGADQMASIARRTAPPGLVHLHEGEQPYQPPTPPQVQVMLAKVENEKARERTAFAKEQVALLTAKIKMIELYKATTESETGIRREILSVLAELHGEHPQAGA